MADLLLRTSVKAVLPMFSPTCRVCSRFGLVAWAAALVNSCFLSSYCLTFKLVAVVEEVLFCGYLWIFHMDQQVGYCLSLRQPCILGGEQMLTTFQNNVLLWISRCLLESCPQRCWLVIPGWLLKFHWWLVSGISKSLFWQQNDGRPFEKNWL